jgi:hypothetical protein
MYGCDAGAPRNSKVCLRHLHDYVKLGPHAEATFDRGSGIVSVKNLGPSDLTFSVTAFVDSPLLTEGGEALWDAMKDGRVTLSVSGGKLMGEKS